MTAQFLSVDPSGHVEPILDSGRIQAGMASLISLCNPRADANGRQVWNTHEVSMKMLERRIDSALSTVRADIAGVRSDAFDPGMGMFNPRDLTYKFKRIMEEKKAPLSALKCFPVNTEVSPGSLKYEQYRMYSTGKAVVYRGGSGADIPRVALGQASVQCNCVYLVSAADINWLENLRANMTGLDIQARKMRACRRAIDELENKWTFEGSVAWGLYGLLNHPYVDTAYSTVSYDSDAAADDIATDFGYWANYASNESSGANQCDTLLIAGKAATYLRNRRYGDNADKSLFDWMVSANPHIKQVIEVAELNDAGGAGVHAMAFIRRGAGAADSSAEIVKPMMPTLLPPDARALLTELWLVSGHGGLNHSEAGDNLVVYFTGVE